MLSQINAEINRLEQNHTDPKNIEKRIANYKKLLEEAKYEQRQLKRQLEKENLDVEKMEQLTIKTLFYKVLGNHEKQLEKEKTEAIFARLKYEECEKNIEQLNEDISALAEKHYEALKRDERIKQLLIQKREWIQRSSNPEGKEIFKLEEQIQTIKRANQEIKEAISPGNAAAIALHDAITCLESAGDWGTLDLLGVDFISDIMKHSKIDDAKKHIFEAQRYLTIFQTELKDVSMTCDALINVSQGAMFADFFFDGLLADWYMQSKISQSKENILQIYGQIGHTVEKLKEELKFNTNQIIQLENQIEMIIHNAR